MNRLFQKSLVASGGLHVLLGVILFIGPAFLTSKPKPSDIQPITFIPSILIEGNMSGGGNPNAGRAPAPQPPAPQPVVQPPPAPPPRPQPTRQPVVPEVREQKPDGESLEVSKESTKKKPNISLTPIVRNPNTKSPPNEDTAAEKKAREQAAMRERLLGQFDRAVGNIKAGTGKATRVDVDYGPGGDGLSYAGYSSWVWSYFDRAWVRPEDAASEDATVEVSVTIARNGMVVAKRIIKRSGDAAVDESVQRVLDRVSSVERPFPEGMKDKEHTYIIPFNMKTKRATA